MTSDPAAPKFVVSAYQPSDAERWDEFVRASVNGTFLHTRRYLGYHRDRFDDLSVLVESPDRDLVALMPVARGPAGAERLAISHPGITFGGLVYGRTLRGEGLIAALEAVLASLASVGIDELDYRPVPGFVRRHLEDEDGYAVFRLGGSRSACHLSAIVDLTRRPALGSKKRNMLRKAPRAGVELADGIDWLPAYWAVLTAELRERHGATPVHSLGEITELAQLFPEQVGLRVATTDGRTVIAGAVTYRYSSDVIHTQYLAASAVGRETAALDQVCESLIRDAQDAHTRYVSFGPSTLEGGRILNESLYRFKHSFGAGGVTIDSYRIPCAAP